MNECDGATCQLSPLTLLVRYLFPPLIVDIAMMPLAGALSQRTQTQAPPLGSPHSPRPTESIKAKPNSADPTWPELSFFFLVCVVYTVTAHSNTDKTIFDVESPSSFSFPLFSLFCPPSFSHSTSLPSPPTHTMSLASITYGVSIATVVLFGLFALILSHRRQKHHQDTTEFFLTARKSVPESTIAWSFFASGVGAWYVLYCHTMSYHRQPNAP